MYLLHPEEEQGFRAEARNEVPRVKVQPKPRQEGREPTRNFKEDGGLSQIAECGFRIADQ
jgi:hypothetical protein